MALSDRRCIAGFFKSATFWWSDKRASGQKDRRTVIHVPREPKSKWDQNDQTPQQTTTAGGASPVATKEGVVLHSDPSRFEVTMSKRDGQTDRQLSPDDEAGRQQSQQWRQCRRLNSRSNNSNSNNKRIKIKTNISKMVLQRKERCRLQNHKW